jgi:hypothetical protein
MLGGLDEHGANATRWAIFRSEFRAGGRMMTMRRLRVDFVVAVVAAALASSLAGCGPDGSGGSDAPAAPATTAAAGEVKQVTEKDYDRGRFSRPTAISNQWMPLAPGMQFTYEGSAIADGERIRRRVVFTVTDLTKVIDGVRTVVLWDRDYNDDQLVEAELAFFAQDDDGNVWHLGQYPEEYEDGELAGAPAWIHGAEGARAGVIMRAEPRPGTPDYSQGWGPAVEYADRGKVLDTSQRTCVPTGCYEDVLLVDEWDVADPAARQRKYYARGVGNVRIGWAGKDDEKETMTLTKLARLDAGAMAQARDEARKLDQNAYRVVKDAYAGTRPVEHTP